MDMNWCSNNDVKSRLRQLGLLSSGCNKMDLNSIKEAEQNIFSPEKYASKKEELFKERIENEFIFKFDNPTKNNNFVESKGEELNMEQNLKAIDNLPIPEFLKEILSSGQSKKSLRNKNLNFLS